MAGADERDKSAAICETCGETVVVWVWPEGEIQPVGVPDPSCCDDPEFQVLGTDPADDAIEE
ncbi:hypothetical protein [Natronobeatus ordinarius]|uniref:hypothetical protein n=1 Tax=Natronobeatus ordinarius TaxID=2963433 RepID=UPI0020CF0345|nr:hypothetical protein [Natronobeatus ordinarius]